jgi:hypothetical protein
MAGTHGAGNKQLVAADIFRLASCAVLCNPCRFSDLSEAMAVKKGA